MPHYTNTTQSEIRWLDSVDEEAQYLPQGFTQITDEEANTICAAKQAALDAAAYNRDALRKMAYQAEADPLYFKIQRGEATNEEWMAKVLEIRARYP